MTLDVTVSWSQSPSADRGRLGDVNNYKPHLLVACVVLSFVPSSAGEPDSALARLRSTKAEVRESASKELVLHRQQTVSGLLRIMFDNVAGGGDKDIAKSAIRTLGRLRASSVAGHLAMWIRFEVKVKVKVKRTGVMSPLPGLLDDYPCAQALVEIGLPSAKALARMIPYYGKETRKRLAAIVLRRVLGDRHARAFVRVHVEEAKTKTAKERFEDIERRLLK